MIARCALPALLSAIVPALPAQEPRDPPDLARTATASASEQQGNDLAAAFAIDGDLASRWSGIPGHNAGVWFQLDWSQPVTVRQVAVHQYDTYVKEFDFETWDDVTGQWRKLRHLGRPDGRLPLVVIAEFEPFATQRLRIGNITNGPSFTEVEVYAEPRAPVTVLGADLDGNVVGVVCDAWGAAPVAGAHVELAGLGSAGPWRAAATSDAHGIFGAPMPLGLRGLVDVRTTAQGAVHVSRHRATQLQYGLTPRPSRDGEVLDGTWRFCVDPPPDFARTDFDDSGWGEIAVPGHWEMQGCRARTGTGGYRRRFDAASGQGRWLLRCEGIYSGATVWVNGTCVAEHDGGALPFEADITDVVRARDNVLAVLAKEHTDVSDRLDSMSQYADMALGGIFRPVRLFSVPELHVGAIALATQVDAERGTATVAGTITVLDQSAAAVDRCELGVRLGEPGGAEVANATVPFAATAFARAVLPVTLAVPRARVWNAEQPFLYELTLELRGGGRTLQTLVQPFGLRQTEVRGSQLLVDGRPIKLRGTCHHDSDPLLGRAVTPALQRRDVELLREANLNALRTSHYPPLEALLDAADELGVYVEDEASFCWTSATDDLRLLPRIVQLECEMVVRDRNHASVLCWSLCNESRIGAGLWRSRDFVRRADPSRPLTGSWRRDGDLDLAVRHNPITQEGIADVEQKVKVPVLWDESWCIWQDIWGDADELWRDPGLRDYYVTRLPAIYDRFVHSPVVQGTQIWAWSDDVFLLPGAGLEYGRGDTGQRHVHEQYRLAGRGVAGDAQWGVVDAWRRRKPEFWHTKKLHSPVQVAETPLPLPADPRVSIPVENQFDFTDLAALRISWQLDEASGLAQASVPPHARGEIIVQLPRRPLPGERLGLSVLDGHGALVDAWWLRFAGDPPARAAASALSSSPPPPLAVRTERRLNGATTYVAGGAFELGIGIELGDLRRGTAFGRELLRSLPQLHVLATGRPEAPLPARASWRCEACDVQQAGADCKVVVTGRYDGFQGRHEYVVHADGRLSATATFEYTGNDLLVREIGLAFAVPRECDELQWERRAEWSFYPQDHIGRPVGKARAFAGHGAALPPDWPWSQDNTPLGCNDFRSSKRALEWGWIGLPGGPGVAIESDGRQDLQALVDGDRILVFVLGFHDGVNSREEWTANYGNGRVLKQGETVTAHATLRLCRDTSRPGR